MSLMSTNSSHGRWILTSTNNTKLFTKHKNSKKKTTTKTVKNATLVIHITFTYRYYHIMHSIYSSDSFPFFLYHYSIIFFSPSLFQKQQQRRKTRKKKLLFSASPPPKPKCVSKTNAHFHSFGFNSYYFHMPSPPLQPTITIKHLLVHLVHELCDSDCSQRSSVGESSTCALEQQSCKASCLSCFTAARKLSFEHFACCVVLSSRSSG